VNAAIRVNMNQALQPELRSLIPAEQIQKRVKEMGRQISDDYRGRTLHVLALLENAFVFTADLVRELDVPVICQFIKPRYSPGDVLEIFFSHRPDISGQHLLVLEGLVHSGVTTEFLTSDLRSRGAASVKVATLLDRPAARRVQLQLDYFGFLVDEAFVVGYGLGSPEQTNRNLPYLAVASRTVAVT
jgi:hypoxanthine phosphoribosyltransferase